MASKDTWLGDEPVCIPGRGWFIPGVERDVDDGDVEMYANTPGFQSHKDKTTPPPEPLAVEPPTDSPPEPVSREAVPAEEPAPNAEQEA